MVIRLEGGVLPLEGGGGLPAPWYCGKADPLWTDEHE